MHIHYFQRYHSKENVETSNTMLLLSRLYNFSPDKFFTLMNNLFFGESQTPELTFELQHVGENSIPDAVIQQPSFKIIVETKLYNQFNNEQLRNHLENFNNEDYKVLLSLDPMPMKKDKKDEIDRYCIEKFVKHINLTFKQLVDAVELNYEDTDISDVVEDFKQYCIDERLIPNSERWLRAIVAGITFDSNIKYSMYYDSTERGYSEFGYLGLYKEKSVRAIGKIKDIIEVEFDKNDNLIAISKKGFLITNDIIENIKGMVIEAGENGYNLKNGKHIFFVVEKFYNTNFYKSTKNPIQKSKYFDLTEIFNKEQLPSTQVIADELNGVSWESKNY